MTRQDQWWEGYDDGCRDQLPRDVPVYQEDYDDGYYAGQQTAADSGNR